MLAGSTTRAATSSGTTRPAGCSPTAISATRSSATSGRSFSPRYLSWRDRTSRARTRPIILLDVLVLLPIGMVALYGIAERIAGRIFAYWTTILWIALPFIGIEYTNVGYHQRYTELFLPQALGLSAMADFPTLVAALVSAYFTARVVFDEHTSRAMPSRRESPRVRRSRSNPRQRSSSAGPTLALLAARRFRGAAWFVVGLAPALVTLTLWKARGLGHVPIAAPFETVRRRRRVAPPPPRAGPQPAQVLQPRLAPLPAAARRAAGALLEPPRDRMAAVRGRDRARPPLAARHAARRRLVRRLHRRQRNVRLREHRRREPAANPDPGPSRRSCLGVAALPLLLPGMPQRPHAGPHHRSSPGRAGAARCCSSRPFSGPPSCPSPRSPPSRSTGDSRPAS